MTKPMTKTQLVAALAEEMGADKKTATAALDGIVALITREVSGGGAVTLPDTSRVMMLMIPSRAPAADFLSEPISSARAATSWVLVIGFDMYNTPHNCPFVGLHCGHLTVCRGATQSFVAPIFLGNSAFSPKNGTPSPGSGLNSPTNGCLSAIHRKAVSSKLRSFRLWIRSIGMSRRVSIAWMPICK